MKLIIRHKRLSRIHQETNHSKFAVTNKSLKIQKTKTELQNERQIIIKKDFKHFTIIIWEKITKK